MIKHGNNDNGHNTYTANPTPQGAAYLMRTHQFILSINILITAIKLIFFIIVVLNFWNTTSQDRQEGEHTRQQEKRMTEKHVAQSSGEGDGTSNEMEMERSTNKMIAQNRVRWRRTCALTCGEKA